MNLEKVTDDFLLTWNPWLNGMPKEDLTNIEITSVHGDAVNHHPMDIVILHLHDLPWAMKESGKPYYAPSRNQFITLRVSVFPVVA